MSHLTCVVCLVLCRMCRARRMPNGTLRFRILTLRRNCICNTFYISDLRHHNGFTKSRRSNNFWFASCCTHATPHPPEKSWNPVKLIQERDLHRDDHKRCRMWQLGNILGHTQSAGRMLAQRSMVPLLKIPRESQSDPGSAGSVCRSSPE